MRNHSLPTLLVAGALGATVLAAPALAADPIKTTTTIKYRALDNGQVAFSGVLKAFFRSDVPKEDVLNCRRERKVTLYRTVNSGFGDSTKKVATATITRANRPAGSWKITSRRSGKYFAKVLPTDKCAGYTSRKVTYERDLGD